MMTWHKERKMYVIKKLVSTVLIAALTLPAFASGAQAKAAPSVTGTSAIVIDAETGETLWSKNPNEVREIASMTKIMAAYVVYDAISAGTITMDTQVPVSDWAYRFSHSAVYDNVPFQKDGYYTVSDMLDAFLVYSSCSAGTALAEFLAGSEEAFAEEMNATARDLGIEATFNCSYDEGEMDATNVAKMVYLAIKNHPEMLEVTKKTSFEFDGVTYEASNKLLSGNWGDIGVVDGVKPGWTPNAGLCLAASSVKDGNRTIAVTMNASSVNSRSQDCANLLAYGYDVLEEKQADGYAYAYPHAASVTMNGQELALQAYLVNGNNYVRLRDFANILNGTGAQFSLEYDDTQNIVVAVNGQPYEPGGSEGMVLSTDTSFSKLRQANILIDGATQSVDAYLIDDLNYMKVRDLAALIGCGIEYDYTTGQVVLMPGECAAGTTTNQDTATTEDVTVTYPDVTTDDNTAVV